MSGPDRLVLVVDDDFRMRESLKELLAASGLACAAFQSVADYLAYARPEVPSCLVLDLKLPETTGLEFQQQIDQEDHPPIIFLTAHGDISSSVRAIKRGAVDFLTKPFRESELLSSIHAAIDRDREALGDRRELRALRGRYATLTRRERDVLPLVVSGLMNKQAAAELGISDYTLQIHRGKIMRKMEATSLADLVRMAERLHIETVGSR